MAESLSVQLDRVQAAIGKIESGGQDVTYDGRRLTRADLATLYDRERELLRRTARAAAGGILRSIGVPRW